MSIYKIWFVGALLINICSCDEKKDGGLLLPDKLNPLLDNDLEKLSDDEILDKAKSVLNVRIRKQDEQLFEENAKRLQDNLRNRLLKYNKTKYNSFDYKNQIDKVAIKYKDEPMYVLCMDYGLIPALEKEVINISGSGPQTNFSSWALKMCIYVDLILVISGLEIKNSKIRWIREQFLTNFNLVFYKKNNIS